MTRRFDRAVDANFVLMEPIGDHQDLPVAAIPALVISTEAGPQDRDAARAAGGNFYLVKPISQETLIEYAAMLCGVTP